MKTIKLLCASAVAVSVLMSSCGKQVSVELNDQLDSLNYAYGCLNATDIRREIIGADTANTDKINDFIDAFNEAYTELNGTDRIKVDAAFFTNMFIKDTKGGYLFQDTTIAYQEDLFMETLEKALGNQEVPMSVDESMDYVQKQMFIPIDSGEVRSAGEIDSINIAFAVANGMGVRQYILGADTTQADIDVFMDNFKSLAKKGDAVRLYVDGLRIGRAIYQQVGDVKNFMMNEEMPLDREIIKNAIIITLLNENPLMDANESQTLLNTLSRKIENKKAEENSAEGIAFLEENKTKEGVQVTESGLQYFVNVMGKGKKPNATNTVKVHYEGKLIDGTVFDSSIQRGEPISFPLSDVIKGWTEGLQLMPVGSKFTFFIPQELAYGAAGAGGNIPPYATLIFDVELLDIEK